MTESSKEEKAFWDSLFGFKIGERVKVWYRPWWTKNTYIRYGTIITIPKNKEWKYAIRLDGNRYSSYFLEEDLLRVKSRKEP